MPMAITDSVFLLAESREHPTHVAGLQLFQPPEGAGPEYVAELYRDLLTHREVSRTLRRRPYRSAATLGQWSWRDDPGVELDYHVRHSALPRPGRVRELLELVSRLHGTLLDRQRPLWEFHLVEGLADGRFASYAKVHHALMDGVSVIRGLTAGLTTDPDAPATPVWTPRTRRPVGEPSSPLDRIRSAARTATDLVGTPPAVAMTALAAARDAGTTLPFEAPATMFNVPIGGARRFAGQAWPLERVRAIGRAADATVNDVAVAMCAGALRRYLIDQDALPDKPLVAMLPVSLRGPGGAGGGAGNAVGAILCDLATELPDAEGRLARIRASTRAAKGLLEGLSPTQILALSAAVVGGLALTPVPGLGRLVPPPFNLIISNVPGGKEVRYWNGSRLLDNYPLSIPMDGQALNITLTSYHDRLAFGVVGCRRSVPRLQRLLDHLDTELGALEKATA